MFSDNSGYSPFDLRDLQNPKAIYKLQESKELAVDRIGGFVFDLDKNFVYLPVIFRKTLTGGNTLYTNEIYRVSTRGDKVKKYGRMNQETMEIIIILKNGKLVSAI